MRNGTSHHWRRSTAIIAAIGCSLALFAVRSPAAIAQPGGSSGQHVCTPADLQYFGGVLAHIIQPDGSVVDVCSNEVPPSHLLPGQTIHIWADVPRAATSALVNLTMVDGTADGYIAANSCSVLDAGPPSTSSGNHGVGAAIADLGVVPIDPDGGFCVYNQSAVDVLADVQGSFAPPAGGGQGFTSMAPVRRLDTRLIAARPAARSITRVTTGVAAGTSAVVANLTATDAAAAGYITAGPCSTLAATEQSTSSGNFVPGTDSSNLSVVPVDANGDFCIFTSAAVDLVVDLQGAFSPVAPLQFQPGTTVRRLDTRNAPLNRPSTGTLTRVDSGAATGTAAVLANLTMTNAASSGFITADRCSSFTGGTPTKSSGNFRSSATVANLAIVPVDADGSFCIFNSAPVDLVVDVQGSFATSGTQQFFPLASKRVADTRPTAPFLAAACDAKDMTATAVAVGGLPQTDNVEVLLHRHGDASCLLTGSPKLAAFNGDGTTTAIPTTYSSISGVTVHGPMPVVGRDGTVEFVIGSSGTCNGGATTLVPQLVVTLPNGSSLPVDATQARPGGLNIACGILVTAFGVPVPA